MMLSINLGVLAVALLVSLTESAYQSGSVRLAKQGVVGTRQNCSQEITILKRALVTLEKRITKQEETIAEMGNLKPWKYQIQQDEDNARTKPWPAFTAYASESRTYSAGATMQFDAVLTNVGHHYDNESGIFTCPTNGLYVFSATIMRDSENQVVAHIVYNGEIYVTAYTYFGDDYDQGSVTTAINCLAGGQIYVSSFEQGTLLYEEGKIYSTFTGFLLH